MRKIFLFVLASMPILGFSQELALDTDNARVNFDFVSEGVAGTVGGVEATISFNPLDLANSKIEGTADVTTLSTGNNTRDKHLKSGSFFDADKYPTMKFKSTLLKSKGGKYFAEGDLTIASVTQPVLFEITSTDREMLLTTLINASDFKVSPKKEDKSDVSITVTIPMNQ